MPLVHAHTNGLLWYSRGPVRPDLFHHFKGMADVKLVAGYMLDGDYMDNLRITKFCLCPRGLEVSKISNPICLWCCICIVLYFTSKDV